MSKERKTEILARFNLEVTLAEMSAVDKLLGMDEYGPRKNA